MSLFITVDPQASRSPFISPYAYCNNNPVMYVDPNGEFAFTTAVISGIIFSAVSASLVCAYQGITIGIDKGLSFGGQMGYACLGWFIGANAGAAGGLAGTATTAVAGTIGASAGAISGFVSSAISASFSTSCMAWVSGESFGSGLSKGIISGTISGLMGAAIGGLIGGIEKGIANEDAGANFFTGKRTFDLSKGYAASGAPLPEGLTTVKAKYVGKIVDAYGYL